VTETNKAGGKWIYICSKVKLFAAKKSESLESIGQKSILWLLFLLLSKHGMYTV
jgi:hypothetical protein